MSLNRRILLGAGLASAIIRPGRAADAESLVLYNGQHRTTTEALVAAFTKATGVPVTVRNGESPALAGQLMEEGARSPADVFYSEVSPPIGALEDKGLLLNVDAATRNQVPGRYASRTGAWVGATIRVRVVAYNKAMAKPEELPKSVLDFATSAWKDRIAYVPKDGFQEQVMAIELLRGRDAALTWLRGLRTNGRLYNSNSAAMRAVEAGEITAALTNSYYWYGVAKERGEDTLKSALHYVDRTDPGALQCLSALGILRSSAKPALAQRFLAFAVSQAGQAAMAATVAEYPVLPGVNSPFALPPLEQVAAAPVTAAEIGSAADAYVLQREAGMA